MSKCATFTGNPLSFVCISSLISTVDRVKHVLPQAHLRLPGVAPTQLVPDSPHWSHHSADCTVGSVVKRMTSSLSLLHLTDLFIGLLMHMSVFHCLLTDNIMHTWQTLSVKGLEHSVGCLGKIFFAHHQEFPACFKGLSQYCFVAMTYLDHQRAPMQIFKQTEWRRYF